MLRREGQGLLPLGFVIQFNGSTLGGTARPLLGRQQGWQPSLRDTADVQVHHSLQSRLGPCSPTPSGPAASNGCMNRPDRRLHPTNAPEQRITSCNAGAIHRGHLRRRGMIMNRPRTDWERDAKSAEERFRSDQTTLVMRSMLPLVALE
jgi:hypothetical protein